LKLLGIGAGAAVAIAAAAFTGNTPAGPRPVRDVERRPKPYTGPPKSDYIKERPPVVPPMMPPLTPKQGDIERPFVVGLPKLKSFTIQKGDIDFENWDVLIQPGNVILSTTSGTSNPNVNTVTATCDIKT